MIVEEEEKVALERAAARQHGTALEEPEHGAGGEGAGESSGGAVAGAGAGAGSGVPTAAAGSCQQRL